MTQPLSAPARIIEAYLGLSEVFGDDLAKDTVFRDTLTAALSRLMQEGAAAVVASFGHD